MFIIGEAFDDEGAESDQPIHGGTPEAPVRAWGMREWILNGAQQKVETVFAQAINTLGQMHPDVAEAFAQRIENQEIGLILLLDDKKKFESVRWAYSAGPHSGDKDKVVAAVMVCANSSFSFNPDTVSRATGIIRALAGGTYLEDVEELARGPEIPPLLEITYGKSSTPMRLTVLKLG